MRIVICGLSITSSWGNGHATTYRALIKGLCQRGHDVLFLERDKPWYAANRDLPDPPFGTTRLYDSLADLRDRFRTAIRDADFASETAALTRAQVLVQANTSVLAQANATPNTVLSLLQR